MTFKAATAPIGNTNSFDDGALGSVVLTGGLTVNAVSVEQRGELGRRILGRVVRVGRHDVR